MSFTFSVVRWVLFPTPAVRLWGRALFFLGGPCLSVASWTAFLFPAAVLSDEVELGVNGFGSFSRKKRTSAAGPKPGNIKSNLGAMLV